MATFKEIYREGQRLQLAKDFEAALAKFEEASLLKPNDTSVMIAMVQCLTSLARHQEAIDLAKKLCEIAPNDQYSWMALSRAYQPAGMIPEAEDAMMRGQIVAQSAKA